MANDCLKVIKAAYGDQLNQKDIRELVKEIREAHADKSGVTPSDIDQALARSLSRKEEALLIKEVQKKDAILKVQHKLNGVLDQDAWKTEIDGKKVFTDGVDAVDSLYLGAERHNIGAQRNIYSDGFAIEARHENMFINQLDKEGVTDWTLSAKGDDLQDLFTEVWELRPGGKPGITGNQNAIKSAKVIANIQKSLLDTMQKSGSSIREMQGYIMRQAHDSMSILDVGRDSWMEFIEPLLDKKRTFGELDMHSPTKIREFLEASYKSIISGEYHIDPTDGGSRRAIHFKDGASFFQYNEKFGNNNIVESILGSIRSTGRKAATMQHLGVKFDQSWEQIITGMRKRLVDQLDDLSKTGTSKQVDAAAKALQDFESAMVSRFPKILNEMRGLTLMPGRSILAKVGRNLRALNNLTKLGRAVFAGITDLPTSVSKLRAITGKGYFEAYRDLIQRWFEVLPRDQRQIMGTRMHMLLDDTLGEIHNRHGGDMNGPGWIERSQKNFFKLTGFNFQTMSSKAAVGKQFGIELYNFRKTNWIDFDKSNGGKRFKYNLQRYGIGEVEWNIIRQSSDDLGNNFRGIFPESLDNLSDEIFAEGLEKANKSGKAKLSLDQYKDDLKLQLASAYSSIIEASVPTPGARERINLYQGTDPDDPVGVLLRLVGQFKSFPLRAVRSVFGIAADNPNIHLKKYGDVLSSRHAMQDVMMLAVNTAAFGYAANTLKDLVSGKQPKDPSDPGVILDAFLAGGTGGLYADFILGDLSKHGRGPLELALGPTFSEASNLMILMSKARNGDLKASQLLQTAVQNTPYQNLWWSRAALDYLLLNEMREIMAPGSARRIERAVKKNPGLFSKKQEFFLRPKTNAGLLKETGLKKPLKAVKKGFEKAGKFIRED